MFLEPALQARLLKLPQLSSEVWVGDCRPSSLKIRGEGPQNAGLWAEAHTGLLRAVGSEPATVPEWTLLLELLVQAMLNERFEPGRPAQVALRSQHRLVLQSTLRQLGIEVVPLGNPACLDEPFEFFEQHVSHVEVAPKKTRRRSTHKWQFTARFRAGAYQWRASALASKRLTEALKEIKAEKDPEIAAEGAVLLLERLVPAIEHVDSSSGALGNAVNKAVAALAPVIAGGAKVTGHGDRLERLFQALQDDGYGYLEGLGHHWGHLCASPEMAGHWAERLADTVRAVFTAPGFNYFSGTTAAFSSLLAAGRYAELLELLSLERHQPALWHHRRYGVEALKAQGRLKDALAMAQDVCLNDPTTTVGLACEQLLIDLDQEEAAYRSYGLTLQRATNYKLTFKAICRRYPKRQPEQILRDLISSSAGTEGQWFAAAVDLKLFDVALECARTGPCNPSTMGRAVAKLPPEPAHELALLTVRAYLQGWAYEVTYLEFSQAVEEALARARAVSSEGTSLARLEEWAGADSTLRLWLTEILARRAGVARR